MLGLVASLAVALRRLAGRDPRPAARDPVLYAGAALATLALVWCFALGGDAQPDSLPPWVAALAWVGLGALLGTARAPACTAPGRPAPRTPSGCSACSTRSTPQASTVAPSAWPATRPSRSPPSRSPPHAGPCRRRPPCSPCRCWPGQGMSRASRPGRKQARPEALPLDSAQGSPWESISKPRQVPGSVFAGRGFARVVPGFRHACRPYSLLRRPMPLQRG